MRIERIRVGAFGRLRDFDSGPEPLPGLVVVRGPNEAGKSTLFHFLTSMLYGFHPATREMNPYSPWDGLEPWGFLQARLDGGGCVDVERRLPAQPSGRMVVRGATEDLRNRPLPWAEHVPLAVFRQVYALTLADLAALDEETWARVQDRIIGSMGSADLVPARKIVAELEQEAGEMWRPNRRGNQRIRDLQADILKLRARRREALERDRRIRDIVEESERTRARLQQVREERLAARRDVDRALALAPIRIQIRRIAGLREEAGAIEELHGLPAEPAQEIARREARAKELKSRLDELRKRRSGPAEAVAAFGRAEARLLERGEDVASFITTVAALTQDRSRLLACEDELRELERRLESAAAQMLTGPWDATQSAAIAAVPIATVRDRVRRVREARELMIQSAARKNAVPPPPPPPAPFGVSWALLVAGATVLAYGIATKSMAAIVAGGAATAVGLALVAVWMWVRRAARSREDEYDRGYGMVDAASDAEATARFALADVLSGLPVLPELLVDTGDALASRLDRVQELLRDLRDREESATILKARVIEAEGLAHGYAANIGLQPNLDTEAASHVVEVEVHRAERLRDAAAAGERELRQLEQEEARAGRDLDEERTALETLRERLRVVGGGEQARGIERVRDRLRARDRADQLQDELERGHADLDEIVARIAEAEANGEPWTTDEEEVTRRKAQLDELTEEAERLAARAEALDRDAAHLREQETVDGVDGEMFTLEEELSRLLRDRDRRWVMAQILREADRRFREEHQPDLVRRAGLYLRHLTGGRYDRIGADETNGGRFFVSGARLDSRVDLAPPLSTGTLEQAYLSLRLAIVDHLDQGLERLPLFVDEVFVNWDPDRRARGMDILESVARGRQLFVFTCDGQVAKQLEERGGVVLAMDTAS